jgi:three-Cys-motif partner protein
MGDNSKIEWTDATWNPVRGCTKISPGCIHCYAETFAERFRGVPGHPYEQGFDLRLVPEKLTDPFLWNSPKTVFVNSMSDLFHEDVPTGYIIAVARVMEMANWHTYQILTKRSERMHDLLNNELRFVSDLPHIWWGVSVEDKRFGLPRIEYLRNSPVKLRFLSIEPLLEDVGRIDLTGISWVIVGGESGLGARPMEPEWVESLLDLCNKANVPFFFKQWGGYRKSKTGRELNGYTYDAMPSRVSIPIPDKVKRRELINRLSPSIKSWKEASLNQSKEDARVILVKAGGAKEVRSVVKNNGDERQLHLLELPRSKNPEPKVKPINNPIWTENKAKLIERYLYYFVMITHHGTYIDGFAGPQEPDKPDMWSANVVLESEPKWLRHFYLFDNDKKQVDALKNLRANQPKRDSKGKKISREIEIYEGDFNTRVLEVLSSNSIKQKEATFCLLDQRTFECHWSTLTALANYKVNENKIELFYFLPIYWLDRALSAQKDITVLKDWWGRDDWQKLHTMKTPDRVDAFVDRMKDELGYKSVKPWRIFKRQMGGSIMYYMIHATDHPQAPMLMRRAYEKAVMPKESFEQFNLKMFEEEQGTK